MIETNKNTKGKAITYQGTVKGYIALFKIALSLALLYIFLCLLDSKFRSWDFVDGSCISEAKGYLESTIFLYIVLIHLI